MKIVCVESLGLPEIFLIAQQRHYASMGHELTY